MKLAIKVVLSVLLLVLFTFGYASLIPTPTEAACPDWDLFCPPYWTPAMQATKNRESFLDKRISEAREGLSIGTCDLACVDAYNKTGGGVLASLAKFNGLTYEKVVKAFLVTWDKRSAEAKGLQNAGDGYVWLNDFSDELNVNHPYAIFADGRVCVVQQYGGVCSGKW